MKHFSMRILCFLTAFLILFLPPVSIFADSNYDDLINSANIENKIIKEEKLPENISMESAIAEKHSERLYDIEDGLDNVVFKNTDGTNTRYLFSENIKYIDEEGNIVDKSNKLSYNKNGSICNTYNDVKLNFEPNIFSGISIEYENIKMTFTPIVSSKQETISAHSAEFVKAKERSVADQVIYDNVFGEAISVCYTPTFSGVKEEIIIDKYNGVNEFTFEIQTNGYTLKEIDGNLFLYGNKKEEPVAIIGCVDIYDSKDVYASGSIKLIELKEGYLYNIIIISPIDFMEDPNTSYPVRIDPTITINTSGTGTSKTIIDASLYQNYPGLATGSIQYNNVGYLLNSNYGYSRAIVRFPKLMEDITFCMIPNERLTSVVYYTYCVEKNTNTTVYAYPYTGVDSWTESSITSGASSTYSTGASASQSITAVNTLYSFDITNIVKGWKTNTYAATKGFLLKNSNESSTAYTVRFASTEYGSNTPYMKYTYTAATSFSISNKYSTRFNSNVTNASTKISAANTFINLVFSRAFSISFSNSGSTNTASLSDSCANGTSGACSSTCGSNCSTTHHRNSIRYSNQLYNATRSANTIYIAWDFISRNSVCRGTSATHVLYPSMGVVEGASNSLSRGIRVPSKYWDGQPVMCIFEPCLSLSTDYIDSSMKLVAAHEMGHVMGIYDSYGTGEVTGHEVSDTSWTCIMRSFNYSSTGAQFVKDIENSSTKQPFCSYCKSKISNVIYTRYFPSN